MDNGSTTKIRSERISATEEAAGSNPVAPAKLDLGAHVIV
jgi:hypothetical protein